MLINEEGLSDPDRLIVSKNGVHCASGPLTGRAAPGRMGAPPGSPSRLKVNMLSKEMFNGRNAFIEVQDRDLSIVIPADIMMVILAEYYTAYLMYCEWAKRNFEISKTFSDYQLWVIAYKLMMSMTVYISKHNNLYCIVNKGFSLN